LGAKSPPFDQMVSIADGLTPWHQQHVTIDELEQRLEALKIEHRDLDDAIVALSERAIPDMMQLARLKKRKLQLRDEMAWCEDQLLPDIIA
jgi:hypothetical protein